MQGQTQLVIGKVFAVEAAFRIEASSAGLMMQIDGGLMVGDLGKVNALGYLEFNRKGILAALSLDLDANIL